MKYVSVSVFVVLLSVNVFCQDCNSMITISTADDNVKKGTGYSVLVEGDVSGAISSYTYLIVEDKGGKRIAPTKGFGKGKNGYFKGYCYLGKERGVRSPQKYIVYAVVTTKQYNAYDRPNPETIKCTSNKITLVRRR